MIESGAVKEEPDEASLDAQLEKMTRIFGRRSRIAAQTAELVKGFVQDMEKILGDVETYIEKTMEDGAGDKDDEENKDEQEDGGDDVITDGGEDDDTSSASTLSSALRINSVERQRYIVCTEILWVTWSSLKATLHIYSGDSGGKRKADARKVDSFGVNVLPISLAMIGILTHWQSVVYRGLAFCANLDYIMLRVE